MELEDSQFEDSLEVITKFEDKCLKPLRSAKCKDLDMKKMIEIVDWAKLIDKLSSRMDPTFMKQTDRLFLGIIHKLHYILVQHFLSSNFWQLYVSTVAPSITVRCKLF